MDNRRAKLIASAEAVAEGRIAEDIAPFFEKSGQTDTYEATVAPAAELDRVEANAEELASGLLALDPGNVPNELREKADEVIRDATARKR